MEENSSTLAQANITEKHRSRGGSKYIRWLSSLAVVTLLLSGVSLSMATPAMAAGEDTILSLVNQARAAEGLGPLKKNTAMDTVATKWANQMATNQAMTHNPNYSSQMPAGWTRAGENVARGYATPEAVHTAWMNSPGHRANIMGDFTDIGISFITAKGSTWAVQNFGKYGGTVKPPVNPAGVKRLAGADRYATAVEIAKEFKPGVGAVYVATGRNYPDALSAAPAAAKQGGPLLLTPSTSLPANVKSEIQRLKPALIVVVGGKSVVSDSVYAQLKKLAPAIRRDGGSDRYETSRIVTEKAFGSGSSKAFFATGANFPDALSASAAAGSSGSPVILVNGMDSKVDSATASLIQKLGVTSGVVAGGTGVVSSKMEASLKGQPGVTSVVRYAGADRYSTSYAINDASFTKAPKAYFAVGTGFADALAGAALAGAGSAPLYVVPGNCVPSNLVTKLAKDGTTNRVLLGGVSVLGNGVAHLKRC